MTTSEQLIDRFATPQFVISICLVALFGVAYLQDPQDGTFKGAIIAAFSAAWGYFIGSSKGATTQTDNVAKALELANGPKEVKVTNTPDEPVPTDPN